MILAGTGHRSDKLGGYEPWNAANWIELAEFILEQWRPERVISGMALGWDAYLATAAVKVGIPFVAAIPFAGQESQWPLASQMRYWELLGRLQRGEDAGAEQMDGRPLRHAARVLGWLPRWDGELRRVRQASRSGHV